MVVTSKNRQKASYNRENAAKLPEGRIGSCLNALGEGQTPILQVE